jgi:hypothetical protein
MTTKMDSKVLCAALLSIAILGISAVASFAADPTGTWRTEENATVRVSSCGGGLCATIASIKEPNNPQTGKPKTDIHNVDPSERNRPIVGLQIFTGSGRRAQTSGRAGSIVPRTARPMTSMSCSKILARSRFRAACLSCANRRFGGVKAEDLAADMTSR